MSAFIVISTSDKLNWIVDGIVKCRPQNPNTLTHIATGKICHREDALYYDHTYSVDSTSNSNSAEDLSSLLANQMAQFRKATGVQDELQIFTLENPIDAENLGCCNMVYEALEEAINNRSEINYHITRILFSYDVSSPCNVVKQVSSSILSDYLSSAKKSDYTKVCYVDNQDRCCAAIATSKEGHDLMLPRMLADLMMLISSGNSAYYVRNAIVNDQNIFSIGYAECMYYFDDVKRYYEYAYNAEMRKQILNYENDEISLDYNQKPLGIAHRVQRLYPIYRDVPFSEDISSEIASKSHDKKIDDIIRSLKEYIITMKEQAMEDAIAKDEQLTIEKRKEAENNGDENFEEILVTENQDRVNREYPDYIDRETVYNHWLIASSADDCFEDVSSCVYHRKQYYTLLDFIQKSKFKQYLLSLTSVPASDNTDNTIDTNNHNVHLESHSGCNIFARFFKKSSNQAVENMIDETTTQAKCAPVSQSILEQIRQIPTLQKEKEQYQALCAFEEKIQNELKEYQKLKEDFKLTTHASSYDNLIDKRSLKKTQEDSSSIHISSIIQNWFALDEDLQNLNHLYEAMQSECDSELEPYHYIHWDSPAPFVKKNIDIEKLSQRLLQGSLPLVNTETHRATKENLTSVYYYFDREEWEGCIINELIKLPIDTMHQLSTHIESKYAIFQILQWEEDIISGLTDMQGAH